MLDIWTALGGLTDQLDRVSIAGDGKLPSVYAVTDLASASVAAAGIALSELIESTTEKDTFVRVDRRLASLWFGTSIYPLGWELPPAWDSIAGVYPCKDGWIRLHTNAPHHRKVALDVLGLDDTALIPADKKQVTRVTSEMGKFELETNVVSHGGCAAALQTADEWKSHAQGIAVSSEPVVWRSSGSVTAQNNWRPTPERPLSGIRVLDLTRVLAGPVATRLLAGFGADVLRIDPIDWDEPNVVPDVTLGKRCARLNLKETQGREKFEKLLSSADILVHGYRPGAIAKLGFDNTRIRDIRPALIEVCLNAYGWTGPWNERRGFDSLVQMSCGIAHEGMQTLGSNEPHPLPVQALDHSAGYVIAAAAIRGLTERFQHGVGSCSRVSLARMATLLMQGPAGTGDEQLVPAGSGDFNSRPEQTVWGTAHRLVSPLAISGTAISWSYPAAPLGSADAAWL